MKSLTFELSHVGRYKRFGYGLQDNPIVYGRRLLMTTKNCLSNS